MPLGFAKSVFTTKPAVVTYDGYWHPNGSISGDTLSIVQWGDSTNTTAPFSTIGDLTCAFWWRGFPYANNEVASANDDTAFMRYGWSPSLNGLQIEWANSATSGLFRLIFKTGAVLSCTLAGGDYGGLADGDWHHMCVVYDADNSANSRIYVDGASQTITQSGTGSASVSNVEIVSLQDITRDTTTVETINQNYWDMAQFVFYDSVVDDISKFYSTGFVDLGTDGTASGLTQPPIYIYVDAAGALQQGGSNSASVFESSKGAVSLTLQASTGSTDLTNDTSRSARNNS